MAGGEHESLEKRIKRLEELLVKVLERLERIEKMLASSGVDDTMLVAARLAIAFSMPGLKAVEAARRVVEAARYASLDLYRVVLWKL